MEKDVFRIFFSWASENKNISILRNAIEEAVLELNQIKYKDLHYQYEEATRNEPGSPHIVQTIFKKISFCDCAIFDVTPFYSFAGNKNKTDKLSPNPNVIFEYGYAMATIGEGRCILLINDERIEDNSLPFDIRQNRASKFNGNKTQLKKKICEYIRKIIDAKPDKPISHRKEFEADKLLANELIDKLDRSVKIFNESSTQRRQYLKNNDYIDSLRNILNAPETIFFDPDLEKIRQNIKLKLNGVISIEGKIFTPAIPITKSSDGRIEVFWIEVPGSSDKLYDYERYNKEIQEYGEAIASYEDNVFRFRQQVKKKLYF